MKFNAVVQQDDSGELYIELPDIILGQLGWNNYDNLVWVIEDDGKILLRKRTNDSSNET